MDTLKRAALLASLVGGLAYPAAAAAATVSIDVAPVSPANGGAYAATNAYGVAFTARWAPAQTSVSGGPLFVEVTNQDITGQDGTLANDAQYRVGSGSLSHGDADPTLWTGTVSGSFISTPGTYFFQYYAFGANSDCGPAGGICTLASPVFSFSTQALPQPPPAHAPPPAPPPTQQAFVWSNTDAKTVVRRVIKRETHRSPLNLHRSCSRLSRVRFRCRSDWRDTKWIWAGTFQLAIDADTFDVTYSFRGLRAKRSCLRMNTVKRCQHKVSF